MSAEPSAFFVSARAASLRAYERGRLRAALVHAVTFALLCAAASLAFVGARSLLWLPLTFAAWGALEWRGGLFRRGGRVGALAGAVTVLLPLSVLRRCCKPGALEMMGGDCCSMPGACAGAGALVGLVLAMFLPAEKKRGETVLGMALGIAAVAPLKCGALLVGEGLGLVGGLLAGMLAASAARALLRTWRLSA